MIKMADCPRAAVLLGFVAASCLALVPLEAARAASVAEPGHSGDDSLSQAFRNPPNSARPRVWWHWMNGNVTKAGITDDLEWMARVGIGGLQNFDAALATPQIVDHRIVYMTPEWKDAFRYTARLAEARSLELAVAASPGWSETGGPWVEPKDGMKKLVWSETTIVGGHRFTGVLPPIPDTTGPFQDTPLLGNFLASDAGTPAPSYSDDVAVLAYRLPDADPGLSPLPKVVSETGQALDAAALSDGSYRAAIDVQRGFGDSSGRLTMTFDRPQTIRSASIAISGRGRVDRTADVMPELQVSDDGASWRKIADLPIRNGIPTTVSFAPVTSRLFRMLLLAQPVERARDRLGAVAGAVAPPLPDETPWPTISVSELRLYRDERIDRFESKAGFSVVPDYYTLGMPAPEGLAVAPRGVVDLTDKLSPDGHLNWTPAAGRWRVLRLGYSLTGTTNHPATAEATGLEVDKFDGAAVKRYIDHYIDMFTQTTGADLIGKHGLRALVTDSIEVGPSNWTRDMIADFQKLRGYDPRPWLPALTGVVVGSRAQSDAFLYDFRRTLTELVATQHYAEVAKAAHAHDLILYGEALEISRPSLGDDIAMRRYADVPMAALWTYRPGTHPRYTLLADMKGAASVAHVYGQNLAAAESLTSAYSPWAFAPSDLKPFIDLEFAYGINRPVIHTSVHQPTDDKLPGLSLLIFGQYFNRHETWAEFARPWVDYISRNAFMLQQGRYFADVAYFFGEEAPLTALYENAPVADAPARYAYDFIDADVLSNQLKVERGDLVTDSGMRYRVLYLGGSSRNMTLKTLHRLAELAEAGATIVGERPQRSPSLADNKDDFAGAVAKLWTGVPISSIGKGKVIESNDIEAVLTANGVSPDFAFSKPSSDSEVLFLHRRIQDGDAYFINNRRNRAESIEARFRVSGKRPEIWRAETGLTEPVSYRIEKDVTVIPLDLEPQDAFFVVFREAASTAAATVARRKWHTTSVLDGPWDVSFQAQRGAPASTRLDALESLSASRDPGIKYFSGTAVYRKTFTAPHGFTADGLVLDLGKVGDVAEVLVNGASVGTAWKAPYRIDIGQAVRPGRNELEVRVADLWVNRLVGDAQPGAQKITFTTLPTYQADAPLRPSGLIGPVTLLTANEPR